MIPSYNIYHTNHVTPPQSMGGVEILILKITKQQHNIPIIDLQSLEDTSFVIYINKRSVLLIHAYHPLSNLRHIADGIKVMNLNNNLIGT